MSRFRVEIPPPPAPYLARPAADHVREALASLIPAADDVVVTSTPVGGLSVRVDLVVADQLEGHTDASNLILSALNRLGLYATRLVVSRVSSWAAELAFTSAIGALGVGASQRNEWTPILGVAAAVIGGVIGKRVERELQLFEWKRDSIGRWYDPRDQAPDRPWGWQPS